MQVPQCHIMQQLKLLLNNVSNFKLNSMLWLACWGKKCHGKPHLTFIEIVYITYMLSTLSRLGLGLWLVLVNDSHSQ